MTNRASERSENGDGYAETEGRPADVDDAMTRDNDDRITRFGGSFDVRGLTNCRRSSISCAVK